MSEGPPSVPASSVLAASSWMPARESAQGGVRLGLQDKFGRTLQLMGQKF
jgi:hypothetical protein